MVTPVKLNTDPKKNEPANQGFPQSIMGLFRNLVSLLRQRHVTSLLRFMCLLSAMVCGYAIAFQFLMVQEQREYSFASGLYWTVTTMSTLGYGDIVFTSDLGRAFSIIVMLSGIIFMLVLFPFTFIELFYEPWMAARAASLAPREVPRGLAGHVILTFYGPVVGALISKLRQFNYPYVVVLPELDDVLKLREDGIYAMLGDLNDPDTYRRARVEHAAMVATTRPDIVNTSVVFTVRGITQKTPVIATARDEASVDILRLAGCSRVLDLTRLIAEALARRAIGGGQFTHVIGQIDDLLIAEVDAARTTLVGRFFADAQKETSVSIVGFWTRGSFEVGQPEHLVDASSVLVMAGSASQLREFDDGFRASDSQTNPAPVVVIGGGRVGRATGSALRRRGIDFSIVEQLPERIRDPEKYVLGSAADRGVLNKAGIDAAPTIIITTHDDETNVYLTIFYRLLRPDIQIIVRATSESSVAGLHRAGADIVMSYASMGSNALFNLLQRSDLLMIAEGLDVFKVPIPEELAGKTLSEANIRKRTHCSVIGIDTDDKTTTNPPPDAVLPAGGEIVLIGTPAGELAFLSLFPNN